MNLILAELTVQTRIDDLHREADARRLSAIAKGSTIRRSVFHQRLMQTAGWFGLVHRGSAA